MLTGKHFLNGQDLAGIYSLIIQEGLAGLLAFPEAKEGLTHNWPEQNGTEYDDLAVTKYQDLEVTLKCAFITQTDVDYWAKRNAFFAAITQPGWRQLNIVDHGKIYDIRYRKTGNWRKVSKRLKNVPVIAVSFDLTIVVKCEVA